MGLSLSRGWTQVDARCPAQTRAGLGEERVSGHGAPGDPGGAGALSCCSVAVWASGGSRCPACGWTGVRPMVPASRGVGAMGRGQQAAPGTWGLEGELAGVPS